MYYLPTKESFCFSVKSQTYLLDGLDRVTSFAYIPFFYYFENTTNDADFMPTALLESAFYEALGEFPLLAGVLGTNQAGVPEVVVDRGSLNMPEFAVTECNVHFDQLRASGFRMAALPKNAATTSGFISNGKRRPAKLASVHLLRLAQASGVVMFVSIAHALVDGVGYISFMARWAEICACLAREKDAPERVASNDRGILDQYISARPSSIAERPTRPSFAPGGKISRAVARASSPVQARLFGLIKTITGVAHECYHIPRKALNALRERTQEILGAGQRVSDNDVVMALLSIAIAHSIGKHRSQSMCCGIRARKPKLFETAMAVDMRPRIEGMSHSGYCGNAILVQKTTNPLDRLQEDATAEVLAGVAASIRQATDHIDKQYIHSYVNAVRSADDFPFRPHIYGEKYPRRLLATNHTRVGHYSVDFGWGTPMWVGPLEAAVPNHAVLMAAPPDMDGGGVVVHLMATKKILARMQQVELWKYTAGLYVPA